MQNKSIKTSNIQDQGRSIFQLKYFLVFAFLTILGLLLLFISLQLPSNGLLALFLNQLASALIVSGVLSGAFELFLRKDFLYMSQKNTDKVLDDSFTNREAILSEIIFDRGKKDVGLVEVLHNAIGYDYSDLILKSNELTVVLNDGEMWLGNNISHLETRFKDTLKKTTVIFVHPESPQLICLAKKASENVEDFKKKINTSVQLLNRIKQPNTHLIILGHSFPNPYALYLGDDQAIITLYFHAGEAKVFPLFRFVDNGNGVNCIFKHLQESTSLLIESSKFAKLP